MKTIRTMLLSLPFVICTGCSGQTADKSVSGNSDKSLITEDTLNKPKVNVSVNKRYDDKGRLIQFDSTYSYFYAGPNGRAQLSNDSVFKRFHTFFDTKYPDFFSGGQKDIFMNDSLFRYDFFNNDYFRKRFELNQKLFEQMYKQMDSVKDDYMQRTYPQGAPKKKTGTEI